MSAMKKWTVEVFIDEHENHTRAEARLHTATGTVPLAGVGIARLNPEDEAVPEIGDELAVARALSDLGHRLLMTSAGDIEAITQEPVNIKR